MPRSYRASLLLRSERNMMQRESSPSVPSMLGPHVDNSARSTRFHANRIQFKREHSAKKAARRGSQD
jgi:hypothetical protein